VHTQEQSVVEEEALEHPEKRKKRDRAKAQAEEVASAEETLKHPAKNHGRPVAAQKQLSVEKAVDRPNVPKKRGHRELEEESPAEQIAQKKRSQPISRAEEIETEEEPVRESRRGRASNGEMHVQAYIEEPLREKASKKRGRKSEAEIALPEGATQLHANENERGRRPTRRSDVGSQEVELTRLKNVQEVGREHTRPLDRDMVAPEGPTGASKEQDRGRRLTRLLYVDAASPRPNYREKARRRPPRSDTERPEPEASAAANTGQDKGRKRTRLSDAELEGVPRPDYREKKKRTRQPDIELQKPNDTADSSAKAKDGGTGRKTGSPREIDVEVEAASSKLSKGHNGPKNLIKPSKKSVTRAVSSDPSQKYAKRPKHPSQVIPSKRQIKHVESKWYRGNCLLVHC
jgi:hypothetical protein